MKDTESRVIKLRGDTYEYVRKRVTLDITFDDIIRKALGLPKWSEK